MKRDLRNFVACFALLLMAAAAALVPALIPVLYLLSSMLMVAGFAALMARYKESGAPKA